MNKYKDVVATVLDYYHREGRHDLPWRQPGQDGVFNTYHILVSEIMLQQTQVSRVITKYQEFTTLFPNMSSLAASPLDTVLGVWLGLGYNRRARYLWLAAQQLADIPEPWDQAQLESCKGIGPNTAAAVLVYSYDVPLTYVETNIRSVIIHHFFTQQHAVTDKQVLAVLAALNKHAYLHTSPREWYWALMDYGSELKRTTGNAAVRSAVYSRQSTFQGSLRQLRGKVLHQLHASPMTFEQLTAQLADERLKDVIETLQAEGLIHIHDNKLMLYNGFDDVINK